VGTQALPEMPSENVWTGILDEIEADDSVMIDIRHIPDILGHGERFLSYLVPIQKWLICPLSALREKFNPRNINQMPVVKFFVRLDLDKIILFLDGHYLKSEKLWHRWAGLSNAPLDSGAKVFNTQPHKPISEVQPWGKRHIWQL
jgi:hypothetical protein